MGEGRLEAFFFNLKLKMMFLTEQFLNETEFGQTLASIIGIKKKNIFNKNLISLCFILIHWVVDFYVREEYDKVWIK